MIKSRKKMVGQSASDKVWENRYKFGICNLSNINYQRYL